MKNENVRPRTMYHKFDVAEKFLQHLKFSLRTGGRIESYTVASVDNMEDVAVLIDVFRLGLNEFYNKAFTPKL